MKAPTLRSHDLTITDAAKLTGVSPMTIRKWATLKHPKIQRRAEPSVVYFYSAEEILAQKAKSNRGRPKGS